MIKIINNEGKCMKLDPDAQKKLIAELIRLKKYEQPEKENRLLILPVTPKENCITMYQIHHLLENNTYIKFVIQEYKFRHDYSFRKGRLIGKLHSPASTEYTAGHISTFVPEEIGKTTFFTKGEAIKKLSEMQNWLDSFNPEEN